MKDWIMYAHMFAKCLNIGSFRPVMGALSYTLISNPSSVTYTVLFKIVSGWYGRLTANPNHQSSLSVTNVTFVTFLHL